MIVIAISGYIQTEWIALEQGEILQHVFTQGIVPFLHTRREISRIVRLELPSFFFENKSKQVFFYGIACAQPENKKLIESALVAHFKTPIYVDHILLGASRSLYQDETGITCIMNTSSATCQYNGNRITKYGLSGGYILGDEGSRTELSKLFISDIIKGFVPQELSEEYNKLYETNTNSLLEALYRGPAFQAFESTADFLIDHANNPYVKQLIKTNFQNFTKRNLIKYDNHTDKRIRIVGKFAFRFKDLLQEVFDEKHLKVEKIVETSMQGLIEYHIKHPIY